MASILALTILFCIYAIGELIAQKTKAVFSTVLTIALLLAIGFWSGLLPATILSDAKVDGIGNVSAGILIVSLGTTIDFAELKREWKVVATALICVVTAVAAIIWIGGHLIDPTMAVAGAPIFAGGSAATLIMTDVLQKKGLETACTFCIAMYVTQKFIGIPIVSLLLRHTAKQMIMQPALIAQYGVGDEENRLKDNSRPNFLQLPETFARPSVYLAKLGLVATIAYYAAKLIQGKVHYFVLCLLFGIIFFALGFLEKGILAKTQAGSMITFFVTIIIFSNLAKTTPDEMLSVLVPLLIAAICGVLGTVIAGLVCAKLLNMPIGLTISLGLTCTFGFPTTMLIPNEIADAIGRTLEEKNAIRNYLLPKLLIAGFVTVTIASVLVAGAVVNMI